MRLGQFTHGKTRKAAQKDRRDVAAIEVFSDVLRDDWLVEFKQIEIASPKCGSHFESNVQQLTQAAVVRRCSANMA